MVLLRGVLRDRAAFLSIVLLCSGDSGSPRLGKADGGSNPPLSGLAAAGARLQVGLYMEGRAYADTEFWSDAGRFSVFWSEARQAGPGNAWFWPISNGDSLAPELLAGIGVSIPLQSTLRCETKTVEGNFVADTVFNLGSW